jgi:hypothetical protein
VKKERSASWWEEAGQAGEPKGRRAATTVVSASVMTYLSTICVCVIEKDDFYYVFCIQVAGREAGRRE